MFFGRRRKKKRKSEKKDYDYLPLFFWDKSLSNTAKIIMCLAAGGETNRDKTLLKLKETFPSEAVDELGMAIEQLEQMGYLSSEYYKGEYGEPRVDKILCICPYTRLPKLVQPTGSPLIPTRQAEQMYDKARDLGFIADSGKDTTYILYDALRIFTAVENILFENEVVILPIIGIENHRDGLQDQSMLNTYPHSVTACIITSARVIILQEDCSPDGRKAGMARFLIRDFSDIKSVSLDEKLGRVTFTGWEEGCVWDNVFSLDLITNFAVERFEQFYTQAISMLQTDSKMPRMTFVRENRVQA